MALAIAGYGTLLKRGTSASGTSGNPFVTIAEVKNISGPSTEVSTIDVTTHASAVSGNYREFIPSLIDPGTIDVDMNWVPGNTTHSNLWTDLQNRTLRDWQIITPTMGGAASGSTVSFTAYVVGMPKESPTDDVQSTKLHLRITGSLTITPF
jgi:hypothetical protein